MSKKGRHYIDQISIDKIKSGDTASFKALFDKFSTSLLNFTLTLVKDTQSAENIVQSVFVNIWKNRSNLDPEQNIKSYLYKAVKNQGIQHIRNQKLNFELEEAASMDLKLPGPDQTLQEKELEKAVNEAVNELPEGCRAVFTLNRFEGFSYRETADILGISVNTVKTQMNRAFKYLRSRLSVFLTLIHI